MIIRGNNREPIFYADEDYQFYLEKLLKACNKKAIFNAYLSGGYTLKAIGNHFGKHYSTISRIVKDQE